MGISQIATLLGILVLISIVALAKRPSWNLGFLTLFTIVWVGVAGYYQTQTGSVAKTALLHGQTGGSIYAGDTSGAWSIFALFVLGVLCGVMLVRLHKRAFAQLNYELPTPNFGHGAVQSRATIALSFSGFVAMALFVFALTKTGYPSNREQMSLLLSLLPDGGTLIGEALVRVAVQGPCFAVLLLRIGDPKLVSRRATLASASLWMIWSNPVITARYWSFGTLVAFLLMAIAAKRNERLGRLANLSVVLFLPVIAIVIFPLLDRFRTDTTTTGSFAGLENTLVSDPDFDAFAQTGNAITVVEQNGLTNGIQLSSPLAVTVPRSLWAGKPLGGGEYVSKTLGTEHSNVALPLPAELYLDFGLIGALAAGVVCGVVVERLDFHLSSAMNSTRKLALAVGFTPFWLIILRGSLLPVSYRMVPLLFIFLFLTPSRQRIVNLRTNEERKPRHQLRTQLG